MEPYKWQENIYDLWSKNGYKGIIKAVPGAGKTKAALDTIKDEKGPVLILVHSIPLKKQWEEQTDHDVLNIQSPLIHMADADVLVIDECHHFTTELRLNKIFNIIHPRKILGLTATPNNEVTKHFGKILTDVGFEEAKVSPFKVFFHSVDMGRKERTEYDQWTNQIYNMMKHGMERKREKEILDSLIMRRRLVVYRMKNRIPRAKILIEDLLDLLDKDKKILVTARTIAEGKELYDLLDTPDKFIYNSEIPDESQIEAFKKAKSGVLIACQGLSEGFNVPDINSMVMLSISISHASHIQGLGRAIRYLPEKEGVEIHILVGRNTTDEKILTFADEYESWIDPRLAVPEKTDSAKTMYYVGKPLSLDSSGFIFEMKEDKTRRYFKETPDSKKLATIVRKTKPLGGRFRVYSGKVIVRKDDKYITAGEWNGDLEEWDRTKTIDKKMKWEDLFE